MAVSRRLATKTPPGEKPGNRSRVNCRRVEIADAALIVLARVGSRGLTHREVDRVLGIAEGSTSAYYRTRAHLLAAAANRLCELDLLDVHGQVRLANSSSGKIDAKQFAARLAATFADWLSGSKRERTLARCELFLEANRDGQLQAIMARTQRAFLRQAQNFFRAIGADDTVRAAEVFVDFALGLLYGRATSFSRPISQAKLKQLIRSAVISIAGKPVSED